jgi:hypothetical protein
MHHQAGRLVDHQDMLVLVNDVQVHRLRRESRIFRRFLRRDDNAFVAVGRVLAAGRLAVDQDMAAVEPQLQAAARKLRHQAGDDLVEALAARVGLELEMNRGKVDAAMGNDEIKFDLVVDIAVQM